MKCFLHHERDAVGLCLICGKALCPDCAAEVGGLICCKNRCEEKAREADRIQAEYKIIRARTFGSLWRTGWLLLVLAAILFSAAVLGWRSGDSSGFSNLTALIGIIVAVRGVLNIRAGKELKRNQPPILTGRNSDSP